MCYLLFYSLLYRVFYRVWRTQRRSPCKEAKFHCARSWTVLVHVYTNQFCAGRGCVSQGWPKSRDVAQYFD
jgi:hypothetical protein